MQSSVFHYSWLVFIMTMKLCLIADELDTGQPDNDYILFQVEGLIADLGDLSGEIDVDASSY